MPMRKHTETQLQKMYHSVRDCLYAADYNNRRVLYFAKGSTTATRVYGQQGNFTTSTINNGGLTTGLNNAQSVSVDGFGNVFIADTGNNRVVMY